jgi:predicted Zn-dependent protease
MRSVDILVAIVSVSIAAGCSVTPDQEYQIGASEAARVDSEMPLIRDSAIVGYVAKLGKSMASKTSSANLDWHFSVVNSPEVNAFALPGGFVYVNRGAIEQADRMDELAGIMGHEIGHVVEHHSAKQIEQTERNDLGILVLCTMTIACRTIGGIMAVRIGADAKSAHYSQKDEAQADSEGVMNTMRAGIDPEGLPSFFQTLLEKRTTQPDIVQAFFSTHPTDQSRVAATRKQIAGLGITPAQHLLQDTPEFHSIQALVKAVPPPPPPPKSKSGPPR